MSSADGMTGSEVALLQELRNQFGPEPTSGWPWANVARNADVPTEEAMRALRELRNRGFVELPTDQTARLTSQGAQLADELVPYSASTPQGRPGRIRRWWSRRYLTRIGRLRRRGRLDEGEYAALALLTLCKLRGTHLRPGVTFADTARLGPDLIQLVRAVAPPASPDMVDAHRAEIQRLGDPRLIGEILAKYTGQEFRGRLTWTYDLASLLDRAERLVPWYGRLAFRFEQWWVEERRQTPTVAAILVAVIGLIVLEFIRRWIWP